MTRQCLKSATFTTTAMVFKTPFNSVFAIFYSLSRLIQFAYFVKCWRTLLKLKSCSDPLQQRNVKKSIKRVRCIGKFRNCFWLLHSFSHHLERCYPSSALILKRVYVIYSSRARGINHITPRFRPINGLFLHRQGFLKGQGYPTTVFSKLHRKHFLGYSEYF